jgi:hypothetical protein
MPTLHLVVFLRSKSAIAPSVGGPDPNTPSARLVYRRSGRNARKKQIFKNGSFEAKRRLRASNRAIASTYDASRRIGKITKSARGVAAIVVTWVELAKPQSDRIDASGAKGCQVPQKNGPWGSKIVRLSAYETRAIRPACVFDRF